MKKRTNKTQHQQRRHEAPRLAEGGVVVGAAFFEILRF
jgi:hypothetical protein